MPGAGRVSASSTRLHRDSTGDTASLDWVGALGAYWWCERSVRDAAQTHKFGQETTQEKVGVEILAEKVTCAATLEDVNTNLQQQTGHLQDSVGCELDKEGLRGGLALHLL